MSGVMRETGWAKINLALHIRRRRGDGYHDLETIFAFVDQGDDLSVEISDHDQLMIDGEFAAGLHGDDDNLVMQALRLLRGQVGGEAVPPLAVRLTKNLPVAAGIGGGSADAAAMARLVRDHFLPHLSQAGLESLVAPLGADVAACVSSRTCLGLGTGTELRAADQVDVSGTPILLVNPRQSVPTGPIFKAWDLLDRGPLLLDGAVREALVCARNDMEAAAISLCPDIAEILVVLEALNPWMTRMSGSGGTCFALFDNMLERDRAAEYLAAYRPHWWRCAGVVR